MANIFNKGVDRENKKILNAATGFVGVLLSKHGVKKDPNPVNIGDGNIWEDHTQMDEIRIKASNHAHNNISYPHSLLSIVIG